MTLYRYELSTNANDYNLKLKTYVPYRETKKCWVLKTEMKDKFVKKKGNSLFAYDTEEKALINYMKRTALHIEFLKYKLKKAKYGLYKAEKLWEEKW